MPKTLAECTGINEAAFFQACARIEALRKVKVQAKEIEDLKKKHASQLAREVAYLAEVTEAARKIGAFSLLENPAAKLVASLAVAS